MGLTCRRKSVASPRLTNARRVDLRVCFGARTIPTSSNDVHRDHLTTGASPLLWLGVDVRGEPIKDKPSAENLGGRGIGSLPRVSFCTGGRGRLFLAWLILLQVSRPSGGRTGLVSAA